MKYIRFQGDGMPLFVEFPDCVDHRTIADALAACDKAGADRTTFGAVMSAGFVSDAGDCFGVSEGLGKAAHSGDTRLRQIVMRTTVRQERG